MKLLLLILASAVIFSSMTIRCDVDKHIESILGMNLAANFLPCGHMICDRHAKFDKHGRAICPLDGSHK